MKRHDRPYGCTFSKCQKTFGSKNDWKRHENSQHYQQESWRCGEQNEDGPCRKVFYTSESAKSHFTKAHNVNEDEVEHRIEAQRIAANNQINFWCGFCERIIDLSKRGVDGWTERIDHIDGHFMGRNGQVKQSISEWQRPGGDEENVQTSPEASYLHQGGDGTSSSHSLSSFRDSPLGSSNTSPGNVDNVTTSAASPRGKRKRSYSDAKEGRSMKHARSTKSEMRIICVSPAPITTTKLITNEDTVPMQH
jgi:hypothetical protein